MFDKHAANGRWPSIMRALGVPAKLLNGKHQECPFCGGHDRFRFTDKDGDGMFFCNGCGAGDGVEFVRRWESCDIKEAFKKIEEVLPSTSRIEQKPKRDKKGEAELRWTQSRKVSHLDPVWLYLSNRRVLPRAGVPSTLRHEERNGQHAMLALIRDQHGHGQTIHITHLTSHGTKANVEVQKRVLSAMGESPRIELYKATDILCVAEGIETALAVRSLTGLPAWSLISTAGFKSFIPPDGLKRLEIYGDNDAGFAGQSAAYQLAERMTIAGLSVSVSIPEEVGTDWADHA